MTTFLQDIAEKRFQLELTVSPVSPYEQYVCEKEKRKTFHILLKVKYIINKRQQMSSYLNKFIELF